MLCIKWVRLVRVKAESMLFEIVEDALKRKNKLDEEDWLDE